jgi:hypothetical protein
MVGVLKTPLQVQTLPGALRQEESVYDNIYNYHNMPVTSEQGPINLDFLNPITPTAVPFFPPSANPLIGYENSGDMGSIPVGDLGNEIGLRGGYGEVYMRDDDNVTPNLWLLDYYNVTAGNGPSMLYSLPYPHHDIHPIDDQADSNNSSA